MSRAEIPPQLQGIVADTFTRTCITCLNTITIHLGEEQPHKCRIEFN